VRIDWSDPAWLFLFALGPSRHSQRCHVGCGQSDESSRKGARLQPRKKVPAIQGKILHLQLVLASECQVSANDDEGPAAISTDTFEPELAN
jgi:hypothetical protein